jgi:cytochrome c
MTRFFLILLLALSAVASADEPISYSTGSQLMAKYGCQSCHGMYNTLAGPSLSAIAKRYASDPNAEEEVEANVLNGSSGAWGDNEMPSNDVPEEDLEPLVEWILSLR